MDLYLNSFVEPCGQLISTMIYLFNNTYIAPLATETKLTKQKLREFLFSSPRREPTLMYCNYNMFIEMTVKTLKTMLPNINSRDGYKVVKYLYLQYLHTKHSELYQRTINSEQEIVKLWAITPPWEVSVYDRDLIQTTAGIEFQTATYLSNTNWKHREQYKNRVLTNVRTHQTFDDIIEAEMATTFRELIGFDDEYQDGQLVVNDFLLDMIVDKYKHNVDIRPFSLESLPART